MDFDETYDVVVIGGGNAGFAAANTAAQSQSGTTATSVCVLEKAPREDAGGNTYFTAAGFRTCFDGLADLLPLLYQPDGTKGLPPELVERIDMEPYSREDFLADINRVTHSRASPTLSALLVDNSRSAIQWMADNGARFILSFNRQAYLVDDRHKFWGGMVLTMAQQGAELFAWHLDLAARLGVRTRFGCAGTELLTDPTTGAVVGVRAVQNVDGREVEVRIGARGGVVLACGGFEASPAQRASHLGPAWEAAHVRGTPFNTGDGHLMAAGVGARPAGDYAGCHSVAWDGNSSPSGGDRARTNALTKSGYPLGVMVNVEGLRFVDEGFDLRNFTYAVYGREILRQPGGGRAFQVWDARGARWLRREEYADEVTTNLRADTLEGLADVLVARGLRDKGRFLATVAEFNAACGSFQREHPERKFDPAVKDGLSTQGAEKCLEIGKTNWAVPIEKGPFQAVEVTCGITFTFGGLAATPNAEVISDATGKPIGGLYCAGELLGGLFWDNYPGGSGLTMGTVMGRIAGREAAKRAESHKGDGN
ncbi:FAD/NAD(P)-binding domain-containing protein [Whalleya microplaca]|nr:FAD/NAD(P)-binding domain-containing protein [Whalleya microplaca]